MIEFFVQGKPRTAGSKSGYYNKKLERVVMAPASEHQKPWMESVKWAAIQAGYSGRVFLEGPIDLTLTFCFLRPKGHFKKNGELTKSARKLPTVKPDLTKLIRAVEDALTGLIWRDDSQVVSQATSKIYGSPEGVLITVRDLILGKNLN